MSRDKAFKVALNACMHKLLRILNARMRDYERRVGETPLIVGEGNLEQALKSRLKGGFSVPGFKASLPGFPDRLS